jgi:hypothetical protein
MYAFSINFYFQIFVYCVLFYFLSHIKLTTKQEEKKSCGWSKMEWHNSTVNTEYPKNQIHNLNVHNSHIVNKDRMVIFSHLKLQMFKISTTSGNALLTTTCNRLADVVYCC